MPPKKDKQAKKKDSVVRIDFNKHDAALKEIEEKHAREAEEAALLAEEMEWMNEEEMGAEEIEEESEIELSFGVGKIDLSFPETTEEFADSDQCYPPSYYTLSPKERLLLVFAENFRKQFVVNNPTRRPLVLAPQNECNVQKFVCTTIRPTAFFITPLITNLEEIASFVADFIIYEPLTEPTKIPTHLTSPYTLLRRRRGNCFEMATLLCSMLIGAGFPAVVVSGVAREPTVNNDQRNVPFPYPIVEPSIDDEVEETKLLNPKYKIRSLPDLESHLEENMNAMLKQKKDDEDRVLQEAYRIEQEAMELRPVDRYHFRRTHAWVAVINNAPFSIKPKKTYVNEDGDVVAEPPSAFFIEPATGFICETHCKQYILIDSVWNHHNYYVNMQKYQRVGEIRWDLRNTDDWEHLLPAEPPEMRMYAVSSEENLTEVEKSIKEEKHLDTIRSWVMKLHIGLKEFEERFPKLSKSVRYERTIHERFSPYTERDGKVMEITKFEDDECTDPIKRWTYFENRADSLKMTTHTFEKSKIEEYFNEDRNDSLRYMEYSLLPNTPTYFHFYPSPRLDSLKFLEVHEHRIVLHYSNRNDRCFYHCFELSSRDQILKKIIEKFKQNTVDNISPDKDISVRTFAIAQRKIFLKFHYHVGALTASSIEFQKPPKPGYGEELKYDPSLVKIYKADITAPDRTSLELYKLLLEQLQYEEKIKKQFFRITEEINNLKDLRKQETREPVLKFRIFDPLRNGAARALRLKQHADEAAHKLEISKKPADFLAPYLVPYTGRSLSYQESWTAYNACLNDMKNRFVALLNDLQRQYEDLTTEAKSLKRFLSKFENQFDNYDYEQLVESAKAIELNKRMVQQRLTLTHEESQKKYENVKASLMNDPRLNLKKNAEKNLNIAQN